LSAADIDKKGQQKKQGYHRTNFLFFAISDKHDRQAAETAIKNDMFDIIFRI